MANERVLYQSLWEWHRGDGKFQVDIPQHEQAMPPAAQRSVPLRQQIANDDSLNYIPNLAGRSPEEVEREANRIRLEEYFSSFRDFERCLQSWSVMHGRGYMRFKMKPSFVIRTCRFGKSFRKPWRLKDETVKPDGKLNSGISQGKDTIDEPEHGHNEIEDELQDNLEWIWQDGEWIPKWIPTINSTVFPVSANEANKSDFPSSDDATGIRITGKENAHGFENALTGNENGQGGHHSNQCKVPLAQIQQNTLANSIGPGQSNFLARRVAHTSVWLPGSFAQGKTKTSGQGSGQGTGQGIGKETVRVKRKSATGACGELKRLLPPNPEGDDDPFQCPSFCPFRVRAHKHKTSGKIYIAKCVSKHTCPQFRHKWRGPNQNSSWLGETLAPRVVHNVKVPINELVNGLQMDYKKNTSYQQMFCARELVKDWYLGGQRRSFHQIPTLMERLKEVDEDCMVDWSTQEGSTSFCRAFVCPSATRSVLKYCPPLVSLYACHTKNKKYPVQFFLATCLDGNSQVVILCYVVAPVENTKNWTWFLRLLDRAIYGIGSQHIPFISDRQKGLLAAVQEVFLGKVHAHCANHLRANVKTGYGKGAEQFFLGCVYANTSQRYTDLLERLGKSAAKGIVAAEYIRKIDVSLYARFAFPLPRMGKVTSNPCEQANSGLLPLRDYAPFKLIAELWFYMQRKILDRRAAAIAREEILCAQAQLRYEQNLKTFGQWQVLHDGELQAKIQTTDQSFEHLVTLGFKRVCTCFELQEMGWPCEHIMVWDDKDGRDFNRHFHQCWMTDSIQKLYDHKMPCFLVNDLEVSASSCPPEAAVKKGRHRVVRIERGGISRSNKELGPDEYMDSLGNLFMMYPLEDDPDLSTPLNSSQATRGSNRQQKPHQKSKLPGANTGKIRCGNCGGLGHNKRTCSRDPTEDNQSTHLSHDNQSTDNLYNVSSIDVTQGAPAESQIEHSIFGPVEVVGPYSPSESDSEPDDEVRINDKPWNKTEYHGKAHWMGLDSLEHEGVEDFDLWIRKAEAAAREVAEDREKMNSTRLD